MINVSSTQTLLAPFRQVQHIKSFPIITTYNPEEAKITTRTFSIQMLFPCSLRPHTQISKIYVFNYYVAGKLIASKHSYHSTALQLIRFGLSSFPCFFFHPTQKHTVEENFIRWKSFLRFELIFEEFPLERISLATFSFWFAPRQFSSLFRNSFEINKFRCQRLRLQFFNKEFSNNFFCFFHYELENHWNELDRLNVRKLTTRIKWERSK